MRRADIHGSRCNERATFWLAAGPWAQVGETDSLAAHWFNLRKVNKLERCSPPVISAAISTFSELFHPVLSSSVVGLSIVAAAFLHLSSMRSLMMPLSITLPSTIEQQGCQALTSSLKLIG